MARDWLLVSETFYTLQGEGPSSGTPAFFVRLGSCDLSCKWCDTPYTWAFGDKAELHESGKRYTPLEELGRVQILDAVSEIRTRKPPLVVITGGEPLLQLESVAVLVSACNEEPNGPRFEIETAGTHAPYELGVFENVSFNVSPKLRSSGNSVEKAYKPDVLEAYCGLKNRVRWKFVPETRFGSSAELVRDIGEIETIVETHRIAPGDVWLMPCATTIEELDRGLKLLAPVVLARHWNLTDRTHIRIWGNSRGH